MLTNGQSASAAMSCAALLHDSDLGTIIGEEPRSTASQYGMAILSRLTQSNFVIAMSHIKLIRPNPELDKSDKSIINIYVPEKESALDASIVFLRSR